MNTTTVSPSLRQRSIDVLREVEGLGATCSDLAVLFGAKYGSVSDMLLTLTAQGVATSRKDPAAKGKQHQRKRYYLTEFAPPVVEQTIPKRKANEPRKSAAAFARDQPVTYAEGYQFTRLDGFERVTDQPHAVSQPFFSKAKIGHYPLQTGSAIERALEAAP